MDELYELLERVFHDRPYPARDSKGADPDEWPDLIRVQQLPHEMMEILLK
jgi:hypothetical protein